MLVIKKIKINRFRSIIDMELNIDNSLNLITICGENNVGKTNTLRALNLFFNPDAYDVSIDRPTLKQAQGGGSIDPKITIEFVDEEKNVVYKITRDLKKYDLNKNNGLSGEKSDFCNNKIVRGSKKVLTSVEANNVLKQIEFRFVESINVNIPYIIEQLTNDMIDVEYDKARFTKSKQDLKQAYDDYTNGLQGILDTFSNDISDTFNCFKNNWNVKLSLPKSSERFRDLISDDVELLIDDRGCFGVEEKGSGLQRLAVILLNIEVYKRLSKNKSCIICIDEPDIYLHEGLQKKLKMFFQDKSCNMQIFYTTHSRVFINEYSMKNVLFLNADIYKQYSHRKNKEINVVRTKLIDIDAEEGYEQICEHLGIEKIHYELLELNNLIVEGECDKKYLSELGSYFDLETPNIIAANGADNIVSYLEFYNSYYKNNGKYKPKIKILLDNDAKGREVYKKVNSLREKLKYIDIDVELISNYSGDGDKSLEKNNTNHEIEDLVYPEIMCELINMLLKKRDLNTISIKKVISKIQTPAFKCKGIMDLCEYLKKEENPDDTEVTFVSSGNVTNQIKNGLAGMFNIPADKKMIDTIKNLDLKYPEVRKYIRQLFDFS